MKTLKLFILVMTGLAILLAGCGPTMPEVVQELKPKFDELRTDLQAIAAALPATAEDISVSQALDPAPDYNADDFGGVRNTDILMYDNLMDPELDLPDNKLNLNFGRYLLKYLRMASSDSGVADKRASDEWIEKFEMALAIQYLGIARVNLYDPPIAISKDVFNGGYVEVDGFLVDMDTKEVLCSFNITAIPNAEVNYTYKEGEDPVEALEKFAHSTLWSNARQAFIDKMKENCGGNFVLK